MYVCVGGGGVFLFHFSFLLSDVPVRINIL